jgi:hypothetical protein
LDAGFTPNLVRIACPFTKLILVGLILASGYAAAQTTSTSCSPSVFGGMSCSSYTMQPPVDYYTPAIIQLETYLALHPAPPVKRAVDIVITTACGRYKSMSATYSDGSSKSIDMQNRFIDEAELEAAERANPMVRVVDIAECE